MSNASFLLARLFAGFFCCEDDRSRAPPGGRSMSRPSWPFRRRHSSHASTAVPFARDRTRTCLWLDPPGPRLARECEARHLSANRGHRGGAVRREIGTEQPLIRQTAFTRNRPVGRFFFGKLMSSPRSVPTDRLPAQPDDAILRLARALARQAAREDHACELLSNSDAKSAGVEQ